MEGGVMNISIVTPWLRKCGIYTYSDYLARALADTGQNVYITPLPRFGRKTQETMSYVANRVAHKADVIHIQHEYGLYMDLELYFYNSLKMHGKPIVTTMHAAGKDGNDMIIREHSDAVIVHNEHCKQLYKGDSVVIPHGCHPEPSMPVNKTKKAMGIPLEAKIVGYIGFISQYKGLEDLIDAVSPLDYAGVLIGGGWHTGPSTRYMDQLRQRANDKLKGRCQWTGWVPDEDLAKVYGAMDLVVVCSRWATESGALLNAMSYGKPVIARDIKPFREKEVAGALATYEDVEDLTSLIDHYLTHPTHLLTLQEDAKKYAKDTRWNPVIADKHSLLYESLI
jgi:glycosyltransferase involved in cell wall biosynthesis